MHVTHAPSGKHCAWNTWPARDAMHAGSRECMRSSGGDDTATRAAPRKPKRTAWKGDELRRLRARQRRGAAPAARVVADAHAHAPVAALFGEGRQRLGAAAREREHVVGASVRRSPSLHEGQVAQRRAPQLAIQHRAQLRRAAQRGARRRPQVRIQRSEQPDRGGVAA